MARPRRTIQGAIAGYAAAPAGSWRASGPFVKLTRPASPPIQAYGKIVTVPIGNDGIAIPGLFTAGGTAQLVVGPSGVGASWQPAQANLYTSIGQLDPASAALFIGPLPLPQYQVVASLQGGGAQVALGGVTLTPGWFVWVQWKGGTPGATAFLYVTGSKTALVT